eukprot:CAMPEP_0197823172 /NCGR_PEP_ID=MMETSP1437-20131217/494_1 /TAXON_ID=49252 ORGANISM="Eucampia antarctica, Strain CCMP1452" /NCGR_SAMPLE_ID=MMETSP1437 /ASSEMBLY_ACC=CAM_ASM_001096 /LENGTH=608 /DNA_ID=CAMNT_0043422189 /DNA_START=54 /DNA_END=1880 /DNA_ORIENTATION=-
MSLSMSSIGQTKQTLHYNNKTKRRQIGNFGFAKLTCFVGMMMMMNSRQMFHRSAISTCGSSSSTVVVSAFVARRPWDTSHRRHLSLDAGRISTNQRNKGWSTNNSHNNIRQKTDSVWFSSSGTRSNFASSTRRSGKSRDDEDGEEGDGTNYGQSITGYKLPKITWYPGHIASAERQLSEILKSVDLLIEVRDGRAPKATTHPMVGQWAAGKPRIVVLTHSDTVPSVSIQAWQKAYEDYGAGRWGEADIVDKQIQHTARQRRRDNRINPNDDDDDILQKVEGVIYVNAKVGKGIPGLIRTIHRAGAYVHERRKRRNLNPRSLRVGVLGFPNVGKSTVINKLLGGKKRAKTANTPGITRSLQWVRVGFKYQSHLSTNNNDRSFELLDSPGIIPSSIPNQRDALLLAACNSIGDAAYDNQAVAAHLCEWVKSLHLMGKGHMTVPKWREICIKRYAGFDPLQPREYHDENNEMITRLPTGEDMLYFVAENTACNGDLENAARKILQDFRSGRWGKASLQLAPESQQDNGEKQVKFQDLRNVNQKEEEVTMISDNNDYNEISIDRAKQAVKTAKELGLELPPMVSSSSNSDENEKGSTAVKESEVGKGLFDGW